MKKLFLTLLILSAVFSTISIGLYIWTLSMPADPFYQIILVMFAFSDAICAVLAFDNYRRL